MDDHEPYTCSCCGAQNVRANYSEPTKTQMLEKQFCFECLHWWKFINDAKPDEFMHSIHTAFVIKGQVYSDGGRKEPGYRGMLGFGGREWAIRLLDGSKTISTNNLWSGGGIPDRFRDQIPDNAEFVRE